MKDWTDEGYAGEVTAEMIVKSVQELSEPPLEGDPECQHSWEDGIHRATLLAISEGRAVDVAACARAALTTEGVSFSRWYA